MERFINDSYCSGQREKSTLHRRVFFLCLYSVNRKFVFVMFLSGGHFYPYLEKKFFDIFFSPIEKICKSLEIFKKCVIFFLKTFFLHHTFQIVRRVCGSYLARYLGSWLADGKLTSLGLHSYRSIILQV